MYFCVIILTLKITLMTENFVNTHFDILINRIKCFSPTKVEFNKFVEISKSVTGMQAAIDQYYPLNNDIINTRPIHLLSIKYPDKHIFKCIYSDYCDGIYVLIYFDTIFWKKYMDYNIAQWEKAGKPNLIDQISPLDYLNLQK